MKQRLLKIVLSSIVASSLLVVSMNANARAVRLDDDDGFGIWTEPEVIGDPSTLVSDIGFTLNFFGTTTTSLTVHSNGSVSFGAVMIRPFLDVSETNSYSYSTTNEPPTPGIPSAIRVQWGDESTENYFQLAIFDLTDDVFAMEFNYAQITAGSDASRIGYETGTGVTFDLLAELGLGFDEYMGVGADGSASGGDFCADPATILACNNYNATTGEFGSGAALLPPDFGGYFQFDPSFGIEAQGRYFFLIDNRDAEPVPEPATLWLIGIGVLTFAMIRRRRMAVVQTP